MRIAFIGPTYPLDSKPASVQQTINMYPVPIEPENERSSWVFKDMPGLVEATTFEAPPAGADWLVYSVDSDTTPCARLFGAYQPLGTPVPFEIGLTASNFNATTAFSTSISIPVKTTELEFPTIVEGVNWFPSVPGVPLPTAISDPSSGVWSGYSFVVFFNFDTGAGLYSGGSLFLVGATGTTVITVGTGFYNGATYEYRETV